MRGHCNQHCGEKTGAECPQRRKDSLPAMLVVGHEHQKRDNRPKACGRSEDRTPEKDNEGVPWNVVQWLHGISLTNIRRSRPPTAAGNARAGATVAATLSESSGCLAGRRFAVAFWLGGTLVITKILQALVKVSDQIRCAGPSLCVKTAEVHPHLGQIVMLPVNNHAWNFVYRLHRVVEHPNRNSVMQRLIPAEDTRP